MPSFPVWGLVALAAAGVVWARFWFARPARRGGFPRLQLGPDPVRQSVYRALGALLAALGIGLFLLESWIDSTGVLVAAGTLVAAGLISGVHADQRSGSWLRTLAALVGSLGGAAALFLGGVSLAAHPVLRLTTIQAGLLALAGAAAIELGARAYSVPPKPHYPPTGAIRVASPAFALDLDDEPDVNEGPPGYATWMRRQIFEFIGGALLVAAMGANLALILYADHRADVDRWVGYGGVVVKCTDVWVLSRGITRSYLVLRHPDGTRETRYGYSRDFTGVSAGDSVTKLPWETQVRVVR